MGPGSKTRFGDNTPAQAAAEKRRFKAGFGERGDCSRKGRRIIMLRWAAIFLVIALIAALLGFTGIAGAAADIARFLFFLFIAIFVILFLLALFVGSRIF
jgi:uncharacterized membrane protein YtjA (UPF0391 family)